MNKPKKDTKLVKRASASKSRSEYQVQEVGSLAKNISAMYGPILVVLLIVASFFLGRLSLEVSNLKSGKGLGTPTAAVPSTGTPTEAQRPITQPLMKELAKKLGMDENKFAQCLDNGTYATRVGDEQKEGQNLGVSGTPSFFINGIMVVGAQPQLSFEKIIDAELKNGTGHIEAKNLGESDKRNKLAYNAGPVMGAPDAKIKIVEFTDFECPFCERSFPTVKALMEKYVGKISLEYRSFPLPFHPLAQKAAEGALCANDQGKFWEMHDAMFTAAK